MLRQIGRNKLSVKEGFGSSQPLEARSWIVGWGSDPVARPAGGEEPGMGVQQGRVAWGPGEEWDLKHCPHPAKHLNSGLSFILQMEVNWMCPHGQIWAFLRCTLELEKKKEEQSFLKSLLK